jgi:hypothetical protein
MMESATSGSSIGARLDRSGTVAAEPLMVSRSLVNDGSLFAVDCAVKNGTTVLPEPHRHGRRRAHDRGVGAAVMSVDDPSPIVKIQKLRPLQLHADDLPAPEFDPVQLKYPLCDINTDHSTIHLGPSGCL